MRKAPSKKSSRRSSQRLVPARVAPSTARPALNTVRPALSHARTARSYQKVLIAFSILTALILVLIVYFAFSTTVITVTAAPVPLKTVAGVHIYSADPPADTVAGEKSQLKGILMQETLEDSLTSTAISSTGTVNGVARGTVTIYNNWSKDQPLQATTRLLSPDGILFRIEQRVDVPAGGKVENVPVYADQEGAVGNIPATRFTLPGLWEGLRDLIYAESFSPMTGGLRDVRIVTMQDLANIQAELSDRMEEAALEKMQGQIDNDPSPMLFTDPQIITQTTLEEDLSAQEGDETESITATQKIRFVAVSVDSDMLVQIGTRAAREAAAANTEVDSVSSERVTLSVTIFDITAGTAEGQLDITAETRVTSEHSLFDRSKLVNKDEDAIKSYFANFNEVESVDVHFSPFWLRRTPSIKDHIDIVVE